MTTKNRLGRPPKLNAGKRRQVYLDDVTWTLMNKFSGGNISAWLRSTVWSMYELTTPIEDELEE